ncbi:MAG: hypothetical protein ACRBM6_14305 [Geminicoccales bacterium]
MVPRTTFPSLMFHGDSRQAFETASPILQAFAKVDLRLATILCTEDASLLPWLRQRFPEISSVSPPIALGLPTTIFLKRLRVRTCIMLEGEKLPHSILLSCLKKRSTPVVLLGVGMAAPEPARRVDDDGSGTEAFPGQNPRFDRLVGEDHTLIQLPSNGLDGAKAEAIVDQIIPLMGRNRKWNNRRDRPLSRLFARWLHRCLDNAGFARRCRDFIQRYDDRNQLRDALGNPETIVCLGNGPSCEDSRLGDVSYDALFRVNHSWMDRSVMTEPDVVFTGGNATMKVIKKPIFGLQDEIGEMLLLMNGGRRVHRHRLRYFSMKRFGHDLEDFDWGEHRPTNGAAMIALAVALQPKRLIIAGIDLFRHPEGSYPGDIQTPNAYTPAHSADKELAFLCHSLDRLRGEVVIFGEILDREWRHFSERHRHHLDEVG